MRSEFYENALENRRREIMVEMYQTNNEKDLMEMQNEIRRIDQELSEIRLNLYMNRMIYS